MLLTKLVYKFKNDIGLNIAVKNGYFEGAIVDEKQLNEISKFPLAPRLFEFAGIIWLIRFSMTRLLRKKDRQHYVSEVKSRLKAFLGHEEEKQ